MNRLARLLVTCLIALLPLQAVAAYVVSTCNMSQMEHAAGGDHSCCHEQGDDSAGGTSHAGCTHCMGCFSAGAPALFGTYDRVLEPISDRYGNASARPLDSHFIQPPTHPPQSFLA